jgi:hypothetical protein
MANLNEPDFDEPREVEGFRAMRARLGRELLVVMRGAPSLRTPDGTGKLGAQRHRFRLSDAVDYYEGEKPPG